MSQYHAPTAVPRQAELVEGLLLRLSLLNHGRVRLPLVPNDFATREAAHGDDHCWRGVTKMVVLRIFSSGLNSKDIFFCSKTVANHSPVDDG